MLKLPGYSNLSLIHEQPHVLIFRAFSEKSKSSVLLKVLRSEYPTPEESSRYENEFNILKDNLGPNVPRAFEMLQVEKMRVMVLEDIDGHSLQEEMNNRKLSLAEKVELAISIVKALAAIQEHGIIHRDIKPSNIVINRRKGHLQIIDFGLAVKAKEVSTEAMKSFLGTLQYMSPEQTGRTKIAIDYRSDYYALGVTLYELFAQKLPFQAHDEMEWVHAHIALAEIPLHKLNKNIPLPISMIVQKLMKKSPMERYQSGLGILKDLNTCRDLPDQGLELSEFTAGEHDLSAEFRLSLKLYGRENEVALVTKILNSTVLGGKRMILVGGEPGVGKTSVCNVIRDGAFASNGYFVFGKYDQFRKDVPFSALISSFNQLIDQILGEDEMQIAAWRNRLQAALGSNAAVVSEVVPKIELIIGKPAPVPELEGTELRVRFQNTFHAFIGACCQLGRPLVIFLDDLQWADAASRALIQTFLTNTDADSLLIVGAYRDEHVDAQHPLTQLFRNLEDAKVTIDRIFLKGLSNGDISRLISDSFSVPQSTCIELAQIVFEKTGGNPFFVSQFLKALFEKGLLKFTSSSGWIWNTSDIRSEDVTSNVLTLLTEKIQNLPKPTRDLFMIAACFGNYFRLNELKSHNEETDEQNLAILQPAIRSGLVIEVKTGEYKFIHDRVQEASYRMLPVEDREAIHWRIAQNLLASWSEEEVRTGIFYLVNHWNAGSALIVNLSERERSAELNLIAAAAAKNSSVYEAALHHAQMGLSLLRSENWEKYEKFLRPLMVIQAESEFAQSNFDEAERIFSVLLKNVKDPLRKARIYRTLVDLTNMQNKNLESIRWGQKGLAELGYHLPDKPNPLQLLYLLTMARYRLKKMIRGNVKESFAPKNPKTREAMALFSSIAAPTYQANKNQLVWSTMTGILASIKEGFVEINGRGFLSCVLWQRFHQFEEAKLYVERVIHYFDPENIQHLAPNDFRSCYTAGGYSAHVTHSCKEALRLLLLGKEHLAQNGDLLYSTICAHYIAVISAYISPKLSKAEQIIEENLAFAEKQQNLTMKNCLRCKKIWVQALQGKLDDPWNIETFLQSIHTDAPIPRAWHRLKSQSYYFIMGDYARAFELVNPVREAREDLPFAVATNFSRLINILMILENIEKYVGRERRKVLREVRRELRFFKKLSNANPLNHLPMYLMALSAWQKFRGRRHLAVQTLQKSLDSAKNAEIVMLEPIANERLAREFLEQGLEKVANLYLREALYIYENWGATAKVEQMLRDYPDLRTKTVARSKGSSTSQTNHVTLDINTVLKASNALVAEIDMSRLANKLLSILIENAGAERGVLVLSEGGQLFVKGELRVNSDEEFHLSHIPVTQFQDIARSVVAYVARTQESMVLESAIRDDRTSRDEYVKRAQVMSTICIPISTGGDLKGMVYLENNASANVFSPERVELMHALAGQIAISLENARMYENQGEAIRMQNELATAHAVQEMLFPPSNFENKNVHISGYYRPASECGGDWWYYSKIGDWVYVWVGDATGHGAPAALVTSSTCSAVSILENNHDLTPEEAMSFLNKAVCRTTKGKINMTFFVGALNEKTGEFKFARASHDPPFLIRREKVASATKPSFADFRGMLEPLQGINGRRLGEALDETFESQSIMLEPGDTIIFYTDGLPDIVNKEFRSWGERGFLTAFYEGYFENQSVTELTKQIVTKADQFKKDGELADDITVCILRFKGGTESRQKQAA
jgi:predicted ATPase/serine phosphatase RsbU (regulator of sigma subunit)